MSEQVKGEANPVIASVTQLAKALHSSFGNVSISEAALSSLLRDALGTPRVIDDLAELFRVSREEAAEKISSLGIPVSISTAVRPATASAANEGGWICAPDGLNQTFGLHLQAAAPALTERVPGPADIVAQLDREWNLVQQKIRVPDPFLSYYRTNVREYIESYLREQSGLIHEFVDRHFHQQLRYLVTVGIGANEQFWHYPQRWYMQQRLQGPEWFICDNPKDLHRLPGDASSSNTLFLEFSRSGKTQEIVKVHEFLPQDAVRIIFANTGPLYDLGIQAGDRGLVVKIQDEIPGRFGKNLTPMLLAPLDLLHLPIREYWTRIQECIDSWPLTDPASPPVALARYLRAAQLFHGANHIYFGTNDEVLLGSADEFVQFWNEGVNKHGNDFSVSRYFGLPRDSHLNIEGILGNHASKAAIFLLRKHGDELFKHPLTNHEPAFVNPAHRGLTVADVDYALAKANADHFGTLMPTFTIELDCPTLMDSAVLSQLWTDAVYCYALLVGVNPGSNPEVRKVRDRSDSLLADFER